MTTQATSASLTMPSKDIQAAYNNAAAPRLWFWIDAVMVRLPALGAAHLTLKDDYHVGPEPGFVRVELGKYEIEFTMPSSDDDVVISYPDKLKPFLHLPWCVLATPVLTLALGLALLRRALLGVESWRFRRPWLRLMWCFRPQEMARRVAVWEAEKLASVEARRLMDERWDAEEVARKAKREAAFEAEVERRLAARLEVLPA